MKHNLVRFRVFLALLGVLGLTTLFLGTRPAAAGTVREPLDNINVNCVILSETVWMSGDILHIRDRVMEGAVDSNRDSHEGTTRAVANANLNMVTGYGNYWGTLEIYPEAYRHGYWSGHWTMLVTPGQMGGIARLQGFGDRTACSPSRNSPRCRRRSSPITRISAAETMPLSVTHAVGEVLFPGGE